MPNEEFLDFGDIDIKPKYKDKYKGIAGEKHRISIVWPKEDGGPFVMGKTHYQDKYFHCKSGVCCEKLGPAKTRLACLVVKYKTLKDGSLKKNEVAEGSTDLPFDYEVMEWVFTETKYNSLKTLHNEWNLKEHDIMVSLKGTEQFQDLEFTPCKESVWQMKPEFKELIFADSEAIRPNLKRSLGQELTTDEIKELLGLEVAQPTDVIQNEEELNDILAEV
ncbi:hypothetical protein N9948_00395 [bacterium]|nr:hypothetical protein [bacterium]